jgi:integrative and conjugative element protein (TIGR02256 family)
LIPLWHVSDDLQFSVHFTKEVLSKIFAECSRADRIETGGILLGKYSDDKLVAHILNYSSPSSDSRQGPRSFLRGIKGLKAFLDQNWEEGQYYLGEWHYHPHSSSIPSEQDIHQMQQIAKNSKYSCPEPILLVVGGSARDGWEINVRVFERKFEKSICLHAFN